MRLCLAEREPDYPQILCAPVAPRLVLKSCSALCLQAPAVLHNCELTSELAISGMSQFQAKRQQVVLIHFTGFTCKLYRLLGERDTSVSSGRNAPVLPTL